jgi:hypothetical protein
MRKYTIFWVIFIYGLIGSPIYAKDQLQKKPRQPIDTFTVWAQLSFSFAQLTCENARVAAKKDMQVYGEISDETYILVDKCNSNIEKEETQSRTDFLAAYETLRTENPYKKEKVMALTQFADFYSESLNALRIHNVDKIIHDNRYTEMGESLIAEVKEKSARLKILFKTNH